MAKPAFDEIVLEIGAFAETAKDLILLQEFCVRINAESLSHYNWVGFYMLDPSDENVLVLGPLEPVKFDQAIYAYLCS
jgi:L-methionine (R)-S-oxide reductase